MQFKIELHKPLPRVYNHFYGCKSKCLSVSQRRKRHDKPPEQSSYSHEIAALAGAFHVQVGSHGSTGNRDLLCAMPNAIYLESGSLKGSSLKTVDGEVLTPDTSGLGTAVDDEYIRKNIVA